LWSNPPNEQIERNEDIAAGDFTGDGIADVAAIRLFEGQNRLGYIDGASSAWTFVPGSLPVRFTAGDVTGDGRSEIIGAYNSGIWYWDVAIKRFRKMSSDTTDKAIAAGDFTGDGIADVAAIFENGLWYIDGATLDWDKVPGRPPLNITAGDVTGDGLSEIIGTWDSGIWYRDVAAEKWTKMTSDGPTTDGEDIAAGDFTGDGIADVAAAFIAVPLEDVGLWYLDGATLAWTKLDDSYPYSLTAGDVNGK
jgi:hypothetical protein